MEKFLVVLFAFCVVPSIVSANFMVDPLLLKGYVYCDTCLCGYETAASKPLAGALVKIDCTKREDPTYVTYSKEFVTGSDGHYEVLVHGDRGDDVCNVVAIKSLDPECSDPSPGRDQARVILTRKNGMATKARFANALGFDTRDPLATCAQILQKYQEAEH